MTAVVHPGPRTAEIGTLGSGATASTAIDVAPSIRIARRAAAHPHPHPDALGAILPAPAQRGPHA